MTNFQAFPTSGPGPLQSRPGDAAGLFKRLTFAGANIVTLADSRPEATEVLRGLVDAIVLTPDQGGETREIELRANLAAKLSAAPKSNEVTGGRRPRIADSDVAGARNRRYLQLWSGAA